MSKRNFSVFLSCEHASNAVPEFLSRYFKGREIQKVLGTHRAYDIGAVDVFWELAKILRPAYAIQGAYTRLAIDLNRNCDRNQRYSEYTENISESEKKFLEGYFDGYRDAFLGAAKRKLGRKNPVPILHLSIHSFTPELNGEIRNADIGILYDPARKKEAAFAKRLRENLKAYAPELRIRFNYPYLGKTDGHTTALRKIFPQAKYLGFEIEMNQALLQNSASEDIARMLAAAVTG